MRKHCLILGIIFIVLAIATVAFSADRYLLYFAEQLQTAQVDGETVEYYQVGTKNIRASKVIKLASVGAYDIITYATNQADLIQKARKVDSFLGCGIAEIAARVANGFGSGQFTNAQLLIALNNLMVVTYEGPDLDEDNQPVMHYRAMTLAAYLDPAMNGQRGTFLGVQPPLEIYGAEINE
jgi:hypothetical protein